MVLSVARAIRHVQCPQRRIPYSFGHVLGRPGRRRRHPAVRTRRGVRGLRRRPGLTDPWYDFTICGQDDAEVGGWLRAGIRHGLEALADADTVIVPSCRDVAEPPPPGLVDAVRAAHRAGARVASLYGRVRARRGRTARRPTRDHALAHAALLHDRYPAVRVDADVLYIDEGDARLGRQGCRPGPLPASRTDRPRNGGGQRAGTQPGSAPAPPGWPGPVHPGRVAHGRDNVLADLMPWALERLEHPLTVRDLAREAGMSSRNLARHFNVVTG